MQNLFDDNPVLADNAKKPAARLRDRLGRFCTKEQKYIEDLTLKNEELRIKSDIYYNKWKEAARRLSEIEQNNAAKLHFSKNKE